MENIENIDNTQIYIPKKLRIKKCIDKKEYSQDYFSTITKNRIRLCSICNKKIKYNSYINHEKSKYHLKLIEIQESTKENPIIVEL